MMHVLRTLAMLCVLIAANVSFVFGADGSSNLEEQDPSISYSGTWYKNTSRLHSGGSAALTNARRAQAVVTFTGTGIAWIGMKDPWSGFATVYLDGMPHRVSTYSTQSQYQQVLFAKTGLADGPHTLTIEITHERDLGGRGSWVSIDRFDIENGAGVVGGLVANPGRIEDNNGVLAITGLWFPNQHRRHSGGRALLSNEPGSTITIKFRGSGISWIAYRDAWSGIARVFLNGVPHMRIDTCRFPAQPQSTLYKIAGLASEEVHVLTIEVTGQHDAVSGGSWVWLDAFDVAP